MRTKNEQTMNDLENHDGIVDPHRNGRQAPVSCLSGMSKLLLIKLVIMPCCLLAQPSGDCLCWAYVTHWRGSYEATFTGAGVDSLGNTFHVTSSSSGTFEST